MIIGVFGGGFVGKATARGFIEHVDEVRVFDIDPRRATHSEEETLQADIIFICLPTPTEDEGLRADTSALDDFFTNKAPHLPARTVVAIRSTIPIGYTAEARQLCDRPVLHNPEFLTARCSLVDFQTPARHLIGGPEGAHKDTLIELYTKRFPGVPIFSMTSTETEIVKMSQNTFFMTKVLFFNIVYRLCEDAAQDFEKVRAAMLADGRIAHSHTMVPGPDGKLGAGGACLPKDTASFASCLRQQDDQAFYEEVYRLNKLIRGSVE